VLNPTEMMLLLLGIVILVGGKKLPELGSGLGKGISEFKKAVGDQQHAESRNRISGPEANQDGVKAVEPAE